MTEETVQPEPSDREALFKEQLPKWEDYIYTTARKLITTRAIDKGLYGIEDIQQLLRIALWKAILKFDATKNCNLDSWIISLLKQRCSLLVEKQHRIIPKAEDGTFLYPEPLFYMKGEKEVEREFESPEDVYDSFMTEDWINEILTAVRSILKQRKGYHEEQILQAILSDKYSSDKEIAAALHINFAKVSAFRLRLKIIYCLLCDEPVETVTKVANRDILTRRIKHDFKPLSKNAGLQPK